MIGAALLSAASIALPLTDAEAWKGDPAVVAIGPMDGASDVVPRCTGVLVAPRVVLTAAHCVSAEPLAAWFGGDARSSDEVWAIDALEVSQAYEPLTGAGDLALLYLEQDAPVPPLALGPAPTAGERVRIIGFGIDGLGSPFGVKRTGFARVEEILDESLRLVADPSLSCSGDSGGPVLASDGTREWVAGIIRSGDAACQDHSTATRVDSYLASFLTPGLAEDRVVGGCRISGAGPPWPLCLVLLLWRRGSAQLSGGTSRDRARSA